MNRPPADENGRNYFHAIAAAGQPKLATRTLASTPRKVVIGGLTAKDKRGRTPLHHAAYAGHLRVLRAMADAAPEAMSVRDQDGNTVKEALRRPNAGVVGAPENTRYFHRMVAINKLGFEFNEFPCGPADVWDLAVSSTSTAAIVQPTWGTGDRMLYVSARGGMTPVDLGVGNVPRYVANSSLHTLVLTEDKCFAWGKNVNGVLGLESDGKTVHTPEPLSMNFVQESRSFERNVFSALGGATKSQIKDPLVGVACCDFHSTCCSTSKVWAWGANRGQMMGKVLKNTFVDSPLLVFESSTRIRSVACTDNALVVLLSNGHTIVLHNDKTTKLVLSKGQADAEAVAARGKFIVVQTNQGKLVRFSLTNLDEHTTIWSSRRPKDTILAFDVSENGAAIVATRAGVYKVEEGRDLAELKDVKGMQFTTLKTDGHFRSFVGVQQVVAGLGYQKDAAPITERYAEVRTHIRWGTNDDAGANEDMLVRVGDATVPGHRALVYARCPALRPLMDGECDLVAAPGGSAIFRRDGADLVVSHVPFNSVAAFVRSLRFAQCAVPEACIENDLEPGPELHEYLALRRLVTRDLGDGLWDARLRGIGCDVEINGNLMAHSQILSSASPVLASHIARWGADRLLPDVSDRILEQILRFAYTMDLGAALVCEGTSHSKAEQTQHLFELWQTADELLMSCLSVSCEHRLFEMLDFELVAPLLSATTGPAHTPATKLRSSLLDVVARYMDFFWQGLAELDSDTVDCLERALKALDGTEEADKELADSFEALRLLALSAQPQSAKKKKSSLASSPSTVSAASAVGSPTLTAPSPLSSKAAPTATSIPASSPAPTTKTSAAEAAAPRGNGGWIQARRKSRTTSQTNSEKSGFYGKSLGSPSPSASAFSVSPSASSASSPGPSSSAGSASSAPWSSLPTASAAAVSSFPAAPSLNGRPKAPAPASAGGPRPGRPTELPQLGRAAAKPDTSRLGSLPTLPTLPTLGSQPAQRAGSAGRSSRPKFNQKDRKKLQQFEDPFALVQQYENKSASSGSPWKQVTAASSQSVLERLERVHQLNNKRTSNGSVWGV